MKFSVFMPQLKIKSTIPLRWKEGTSHITFVDLLNMMLEHLANIASSTQKQSSEFEKYNFYYSRGLGCRRDKKDLLKVTGKMFGTDENQTCFAYLLNLASVIRHCTTELRSL